jgi:tyrosine-protein phosphatase SIW14
MLHFHLFPSAGIASALSSAVDNTAAIRSASRGNWVTRTSVQLLSALLLASCATRPPTPPTHSWAQPCDTCIAGVQNFGKVSPVLWRGAQPTQEGYRNLELAGVKTVISLRGDHDDYEDFEKLGGAPVKFKYLRIPMGSWRPDKAQLVLFLKVLERVLKDPASQPIFVHCAAGKDRTGYALAGYRMVFEGWTPNDAIQEMFDYRFNTRLIRIPPFLQTLDVDNVKMLMSLAPL